MLHQVIIGAGSGVGAALARRIAAPNTRMLLHTGRNRDGLEAVAAACREKGAAVDLALGDLTEDASFAAIGGWLDHLSAGGLAALVFAAGYARRGGVGETPPDALARGFDAMPLAFHRLMTMAAPKLAPGRGRVVCIGAFGAHRSARHLFAATGPAKAALEAQVRIFAAELAPLGVAVNAVVPGFVEKEPGAPSSLTAAEWSRVAETVPMRRIGRREEVAAMIAFLLSEDAGYITGQSFHVDGGLTL